MASRALEISFIAFNLAAWFCVLAFAAH